MNTERLAATLLSVSEHGRRTKWIFVEDTSRPAVQAGRWRNAALRLTVQPTTRHKFNVFWDPADPLPGSRLSGKRRRLPSVRGRQIICGTPNRPIRNAPRPRRPRSARTERLWTTGPAGDMDIAGQQWPPASRRASGVPEPMGRHGTARWPADPSHSDNQQCTVSCASNGNIPRPDISLRTVRKSYQGW